MQVEHRLNRFTYSQGEWLCVKLLTGILWLLVITRVTVISGYRGQPFPEGICRLFNCSALVGAPLSYIVIALAAVLVILYISEKFMVSVLIGISLISISVLSVERSHGLNSRDELWSMVFIAQAIAYIRHSFGSKAFKGQNAVRHVAMFYSIQLIAAAYVIAGITKLQTAGLNWIVDSPNIALATTKIFQQIEIEFGIGSNNVYHNSVLYVIGHYPNFIRVLFAGALLIELCAFIAMFSRQHARRYGFLLLALHLGIAAVTAIIIPVFIFCIVIYLIGWPKAITMRLDNTASRLAGVNS